MMNHKEVTKMLSAYSVCVISSLCSCMHSVGGKDIYMKGCSVVIIPIMLQNERT